jgi:hypothetical protein
MSEDSTAPPHAGWPLAEQYLLRVLPLIPADAREQPGSARFRLALRRIAVDTGLLPTRSETRRAMAELRARGALPRSGER